MNCTELDYLQKHARPKPDVSESPDPAPLQPAIKAEGLEARFHKKRGTPGIPEEVKAAIASLKELQKTALGFQQYKIKSYSSAFIRTVSKPIRYYAVETYTRSGIFIGTKFGDLSKDEILDFINNTIKRLSRS